MTEELMTEEMMMPHESPDPFGNMDVAKALTPGVNPTLSVLLPGIDTGLILDDRFVAEKFGASPTHQYAIGKLRETSERIGLMTGIAENVDGKVIFGTPAVAERLARSKQIGEVIKDELPLFGGRMVPSHKLLQYISCRLWLLEHISSGTFTPDAVDQLKRKTQSKMTEQLSLQLRELKSEGIIEPHQEETWIIGKELKSDLTKITINPAYETSVKTLAQVREISSPENTMTASSRRP